MLGISGFTVLTPYFSIWLVPKDHWPTQQPAIVLTVVYFAVALISCPGWNTLEVRARRRAMWVGGILFAATLALGIISRIYLITTLKAPGIDVPILIVSAVKVKLRNSYHEVFALWRPEVFDYPPFCLLYYLPFVYVGLDIR